MGSCIDPQNWILRSRFQILQIIVPTPEKIVKNILGLILGIFHTFSQGRSPKGVFPGDNFQCGNFPKVRLGLLQRCRLQWGSTAITKTLRLGLTWKVPVQESGKLPLLNIPLGKLLLSKKPLGKFLILKNIRYFPNKKRVKLKRRFLFKSFLLRFSVMQWFD